MPADGGGLTVVGMEQILTFSLALGLAAAAGLRLFVPAFVLSLAARLELVQLAGGFEWISSPWVTAMLGIAMLLEIGAYFIPWVDNLLDAISLPAASLAGVLLAASVMVEIDPALRWVLAAIAGGGTATLMHTSAAATRLGSSVTTAGVMNPVVTSVETAGSLLVSILAILVPIAALVLIVMASAWLWGRRRRRSAA